MSEDKLPTPTPDESGDPGGADDELLRRAAREIRASASLQALVPLSPEEREQLADAAIEQAFGPIVARAPALESAIEPARAAIEPARAAIEPARAAIEPVRPAIEPVRPAIESGRSAPTPAAAAPPLPAPAPPLPGVDVAPLRPRRRARYVGAIAAASFALAAVVAVVLQGGRRTVPPLPAYAMVVEGEQRARGAAVADPRAPVKLRPETRLSITLTAERPERDALLRLVLVRTGQATLLDPPVARGKAGHLAIEGPAAELLGAQVDGPAELVIVLGRALPIDDEIRALALGASGDAARGLQVLRRAVVLEGFSHTAIELLLGGCRAVIAPGAPASRPRCEVAAGGRLRLWVGVPATAALAIDLDGAAIAPAAQPRGGGAAFDLELGTRTGVLSVRVAAREIAAWEIAPSARFAQVQAAEHARLAGKLDEADAALDAIADDASAEEQLEAMRWRAKIAFRRGDVDHERARREQAVALARSLGRISVEVDESVALIYSLRNDHALTQAMQRLPALDAHAPLYAEGAVRRELVHGLLASDLGDLGAALGAFQRALAIAERIDDTTDRAAILGPLADVLQALGRDDEVRALIDAELQRGERDADVCARVDALTNAGWLLRDIEPAGAQRLADQAAALAEARCTYRVPLALVNQGWLLAATGRFAEARAIVDRLGALQAHDGFVATWALRLEAETVLGEDPARAEHYAQPLAARAAALCSTELSYEADLLHARALASLARPGPAARAFAKAARALTLWSHLVPLGEGRATFFQRHDQLALTAIPFFLAQTRARRPGAELALAATVRQSIARFLLSLAGGGRARVHAQQGGRGRDDSSKRFEQTLDRWPARLGTRAQRGAAVAGVCETRDAVALAAPAPALTTPPAHAALLVHPSPRGLLVLAWRGSAIDLRELPRAEADERAEALAVRIARAAAPMLAGAPRVHIHAHRSLARLPLDRSLAAELDVPIAFAVDAPAPTPGPRCTGARRALLVTNPQQNLWAASEAAPAIRGDLERRGLAVDLLDGAAATRAAIEARLADPCTVLFHYDGHGIAAAQRGLAGGLTADRTEDALLLAGGDALTAADVLGLSRVPDAVVLNGCTTAAPEGLGLAQAFVFAGAAQVVASLDELPADDAARFTRKLYARDAGAHDLDLVRLFARATAGADLPALRVFER
jgi:tetratricopeptide (TPR) repeat protein